MELRQLKYFLAAARRLSFTEAARECCIVQSAMSQQIRALEKELDAPLFERTKHGLRLTPEGEALEREAALLLTQVARLQSAVQQARTDGEFTLRVGCQGSLLRAALPKALAALRREHPRMEVRVESALRQTLLTGLREGWLDCAVMLREEDADDGLMSRLISQEPLCAAVPAASPLAKAEKISFEALSGQPMLLCATEMDSPLLSRRLIRYAGDRPPVLVDSQSAAEALVAAGCGVSLCVESAARPHPEIVYRPLPDIPRLRACLVWPGESALSALSEALASLLVMGVSEKNGVF